MTGKKKLSDLLKECAEIESWQHWTTSRRFREIMQLFLERGYTYAGFRKWVDRYAKEK